MKGIFSLFILLVSAASCYAQDAIYFKDGRREFGKILEVRQNSIVFKRKSNPYGPSYEEYKSRIQYVNYGDTLIERYTRTLKAIQIDSTKLINNVSHKGLYIGLWSWAGVAYANGDSPRSGEYSFTAYPRHSYSAGYIARYIFKKHFGISVGMIYCSFEYKYHEYYSRTGTNGFYYRNENALMNINWISFPIVTTFITGSSDRISFNPEAGFIAGIIISGYKINALTNQKDTEEVRRDATGAFYIALNTSFPISKKISLTLGPYYMTGATSSYGGVFKLWFKL